MEKTQALDLPLTHRLQADLALADVIRSGLRACLASLRIGFYHVFAYRTEVVIQLVSACIVAGLNGSLWTAAVRGQTSVAGVPSGEMISYVCMAWVSVTFFATRINEEIGRRFREGQIAADLLRPISLQLHCYARDLGRAYATLLLQTIPLFLLCLTVFPVQLPTRASTWLLWLVSLTLAHLTNYALSFMIGVAALPLHNISGLTHLKATLVSVFSGALIPLELFPKALQPYIFALPFHSFVHTPASIFLERDVSVAGLLGEQVAWAATMWILAMVAWRAAANTLTVQGG
jgi:ABC-2 type transport system permease protein